MRNTNNGGGGEYSGQGVIGTLIDNIEHHIDEKAERQAEKEAKLLHEDSVSEKEAALDNIPKNLVTLQKIRDVIGHQEKVN